MSTLIPILSTLLGTAAFAADPSAPHTNQGILQPIVSLPDSIQLTAEEQRQFDAGEVVLRQETTTGQGEGVAVQRIDAPIETVWEVILDYDEYPARISTVDTCEVYRERGDDVYVDMQSSVMGIRFGQYTRNSVHRDEGYMSWTLDYSRLSDVEDMIGYWRLEQISSNPAVTRLEYGTELMVGQVPGFLVGFLTRDALRSGTAWVKEYSEAAAN